MKDLKNFQELSVEVAPWPQRHGAYFMVLLKCHVSTDGAPDWTYWVSQTPVSEN